MLLGVLSMEGLGRGAKMLLKLLFNLEQPHDGTFELGRLPTRERAHFLQAVLELLVHDEGDFDVVAFQNCLCDRL